MTNTLCVVGCGQPAETDMCNVCWSNLRRQLESIPVLLDELDVTVTKQAKISAGGIGFVTGNPETALPIHLGASTAAAELRDKLSSWVRDLWECHAPRWAVCLGCGAKCPAGREEHNPAFEGIECRGRWESRLDVLDIIAHPIPLARWIMRHPSWVQSHPAAMELHDELTSTIQHAKRLIYGPGDRVYLGQCWGELPDDELCLADVYGLQGRSKVACPSCGHEWDMKKRRQWLLEELKDEELTATGMSRALPVYLDRKLTAAMVRGYAFRGRLAVRSFGEDDGLPRYRVGDLMELLDKIAVEEAAAALAAIAAREAEELAALETAVAS